MGKVLTILGFAPLQKEMQWCLDQLRNNSNDEAQQAEQPPRQLPHKASPALRIPQHKLPPVLACCSNESPTSVLVTAGSPVCSELSFDSCT